MRSPAVLFVHGWMLWLSLSVRWRKHRLTLIGPVLFACAMLSTGCAPRPLPDPRIPHRIAADAVVEVWVRLPDGTLGRAKVRAAEGWWLASPQVVDP